MRLKNMGEISIGGLVNNIVRDYDRNRNGQLELDKKEDYFDEKTSRYEGDRYITEVHRYTYDSLFKVADTNGDRVITKDELAEVVKKFDKDNDGKLTARSFWDWVTGKPKGEYDVFSEDLPEMKRLIRRDVFYNPNPNFPNHPNYPLGDFPINPKISEMA